MSEEIDGPCEVCGPGAPAFRFVVCDCGAVLCDRCAAAHRRRKFPGPTVPRSVAEGLYEALEALAKEANDVLTDHAQDEIEDPCGHADRSPWAKIHGAALESLKPSVIQARAALEAARKALGTPGPGGET